MKVETLLFRSQIHLGRPVRGLCSRAYGQCQGLKRQMAHLPK